LRNATRPVTGSITPVSGESRIRGLPSKHRPRLTPSTSSASSCLWTLSGHRLLLGAMSKISASAPQTPHRRGQSRSCFPSCQRSAAVMCPQCGGWISSYAWRESRRRVWSPWNCLF